MTEHERRVNDKDIKSYEKMDQQIHSKIPGIKGYDQDLQEKYIGKMFSQIPQQSNTSLGTYNIVNNNSPLKQHGGILNNLAAVNQQPNLGKGSISNKSQLSLGGQS